MNLRNPLNRARHAGLPAFALLALAACSAANSGDGGRRTEYSQSDRSSHPIITGAKAKAYPETALVDLFNGGKPAGSCSGVVIAPRVVLTSGRCIEGHDGWRVVTPFAKAQTRVTKTASTQYTSAGQALNPASNDLGVIVVAEPFVLDSFPIVAKQKVALGTMVINVGRGRDGKPSDHETSQGKAVELADGAEAGFPNDYQTEQVIENDDFGGPAFLTGGLPHTVVGVNSAIGYETQLIARTDLEWAWLDGQVLAHGGYGPSGGGAGGAPGEPDAGGTGGSVDPGQGGSDPGQGGSEPGQGGSDPGQGGSEPGQGGSDPGQAGADPGGDPACNGNPEFEPNDSEQPQSLFPAMCGRIDTPDDEDWYVFGVGGAGVGYRVETIGGDTEVLMWKLVDGAYYPLANVTPSLIENTSNGEGTYYVAIWSPSGSPADYRLTLAVTNP